MSSAHAGASPFDAGAQPAPLFALTAPASSLQVLEYIDESMPPETPLAFGLHPNAEIGFKLREAEMFCNSLVQLQPRESSGEGGMSADERAKLVLDEVVDKLPDVFDMEDVRSRINPEDPNMPFVMVAIQVRRGG
jgi:dynein heavy chain